MSTRGENVDRRVVGGDGPGRRTRTAPLLAAVAALVAGLLLGTVAPGTAASAAAQDAESTAQDATSAQDTTTTQPATTAQRTTTAQPASAAAGGETPAPTPTASETPTPQQDVHPAPPGGSTPIPFPTETPAVAPRISDPGDVTSATVRLHGTATPGHVLRVTGCGAVTTHRDGSWSCLATLRSGPRQVFTVTDATAPRLGTARTPTSDVIVPPVVTPSTSTNGTVAGTGYPGSTVALSLPGTSGQRTTVVGSDGRWVVRVVGATSAPTHRSAAAGDQRVTVTATQTASTAAGYRSDLRSAASAPVTVTFDRTPPGAPRITAPRSGAAVGASTTVSGTGEAGTTVTVYLDRAPVCTDRVGSDGSWSCAGAAAASTPGTHRLTASLHDAAGNFSRSSAAVRVTVPAQSPSTPPTDHPAPSSATGSPTGSATTGGGPTDGATDDGHGPDPTGAAGSADGPTAGGTGATGGPGTGTPDWSGPAGDWSAATAYDATVPPIQSLFSWRTVLVATSIAAGFLLLVAAPLALVAGVAHGRIRRPSAGVLGRNRPRSERRRGDDVLPTWASVTLGVLVASLCTLLGVGVQLEARYVRLAIGVVLGTALLAAVLLLATRWGAGRDHRLVGVRVSPWLVLAALVGCAVTRAADVSPALVVGLVLVPAGRADLDTGAVRLGADLARRTRSAVVRSVSLSAVAVLGWVVHGLVARGGFWGALVSETAITVCLGGLGALVVSLLPFPGSVASALLVRSADGPTERRRARSHYVGIAAVTVALAGAVASGTTGAHLPVVAIGVGVAACTLAAGSAFLWFRLRAASPAT